MSANNYKLIDGLDLKQIYEILDKKNVVCFESYDSEHYFYYDLSDEASIPVFLGLLCSEEETIGQIFACDRGMYGIAAKTVIMRLIDLMEDYPEFAGFVRDIYVEDYNGNRPYQKFLLWLLSKKLQYVLENETSSSFNARLCIAKIQKVIQRIGFGSEFLLPILANCGLNIIDSNGFYADSFFESIIKNDLEALPRSAERFSEEGFSVETSDSAASVFLS
jgi:hypothetical protein